MRNNFYAQMCDGQNMKHKKRKNTGSICLIPEIIIIISLLLVGRKYLHGSVTWMTPLQAGMILLSVET